MGSITDKDLTATSVKVSATITDKRGFDILGRGFCWSAETTEPSVNGNKVEIKNNGCFRRSYRRIGTGKEILYSRVCSQ